MSATLKVVKAEALSVTPPSEAEVSSPLSLERFLTAWVEAVNDYLQRQYHDIIQQEPSLEQLAEYRVECKWLLRSALKLDSMLKDPEYPARQFRSEVAGKLLQLQESWDSLNNPMTFSEAEATLKKAFPD